MTTTTTTQRSVVLVNDPTTTMHSGILPFTGAGDTRLVLLLAALLVLGGSLLVWRGNSE